MKRNSLEDIQKKINQLTDEKLRILEYRGYSEPCKIKCINCGIIYSFSQFGNCLTKIKSKNGLCKNCTIAKRKKQRFEKDLIQLFPNEKFEILSFNGINGYLELKCKECKKITRLKQAKTIKKRKYLCNQCFPVNLNYLKNIKQKLKEFFDKNDRWELVSDLEEISSSSDLVLAKCKRCNTISQKNPYLYLKGIGCLNCDGNKKLTTKEFKKKLDDDYELLSEYKTNKDKVLLRHKKCGFCWSVTPDAYINQGQRCPKCKRFHSKGEKRIEKFLLENNIQYDKEFPCKIKNHFLRFDFYLPEYDRYIEFNGIQHYEPYHFGGSLQDFKKQQRNDNLKQEYCENKLLIISYQDIDKIEKKIKSFLGSTTISKESTL